MRTERVGSVEYAYTVIFEAAEEGGYVVTVPALPGCVTEGETLEEAREMAKEAILGYLEALQKGGEDIPTEREPAIAERVAVSLSRR
jgi:predicted RNase H-like HicB family nuclease